MTRYLDPRSGATYPLDVPRWCGDAGQPLILEPMPGIQEMLAVGDGERRVEILV